MATKNETSGRTKGRGRATDTTREVQAELRAFSTILHAIRERLRALVPVVERQPGFIDNDKASRAGDDQRFTVEWSIRGALETDGGALEDVARHLAEDGAMTETEAAQHEAASRKRAAATDRRLAKEAARRARAQKAVGDLEKALERNAAALRRTADVLRLADRAAGARQ
jgi:hypothetical protein